jgi:hypothetical protein
MERSLFLPLPEDLTLFVDINVKGQTNKGLSLYVFCP